MSKWLTLSLTNLTSIQPHFLLSQCRLDLLKTSWLWPSLRRSSPCRGCPSPGRPWTETCRATESSTGPTCPTEVLHDINCLQQCSLNALTFVTRLDSVACVFPSLERQEFLVCIYEQNCKKPPTSRQCCVFCHMMKRHCCVCRPWTFTTVKSTVHLSVELWSDLQRLPPHQ